VVFLSEVLVGVLLLLLFCRLLLWCTQVWFGGVFWCRVVRSVTILGSFCLGAGASFGSVFFRFLHLLGWLCLPFFGVDAEVCGWYVICICLRHYFIGVFLLEVVFKGVFVRAGVMWQPISPSLFFFSTRAC
jgi:hypothetical protein